MALVGSQQHCPGTFSNGDLNPGKIFHKEENDCFIIDEGREEQTHGLWTKKKEKKKGVWRWQMHYCSMTMEELSVRRVSFGEGGHLFLCLTCTWLQRHTQSSCLQWPVYAPLIFVSLATHILHSTLCQTMEN